MSVIAWAFSFKTPSNWAFAHFARTGVASFRCHDLCRNGCRYWPQAVAVAVTRNLPCAFLALLCGIVCCRLSSLVSPGFGLGLAPRICGNGTEMMLTHLRERRQ